MKTVRLLYPDYLSGGLTTYYLGSQILSLLVPENTNQEELKVAIPAPSGKDYPVEEGITARSAITDSMKEAYRLLEAANPDKVITLGGNCIVSQAPFDYLHAKYENVGIIWIDAHPDVTTPADNYPFAHAMVLGNLLGAGDAKLSSLMKGPKFKGSDVLYVGLQGLHPYQEAFLKEKGIDFKIQDKAFVEDAEILAFMKRFDHILVHFDIDVLDATRFSDTYFANPELTGDGSGSGKMTLKKLASVLALIEGNSDVVGLTIAEYLPFTAEKLQKLFKGLKIFH